VNSTPARVAARKQPQHNKEEDTMKRTCLITAILMITIAMNFASATQLDTRDVSEDALWVVHVDMGALRQTELGRHIMNEISTDEANRKIDAFKAIFQFDPRKDLDAMTLYGTGKERKEGVALIRGRFDTGHLVTLIKANEQYSGTVHVTRMIHRWAEEHKGGKLTYGCIARNDLIIVGEDEALVKHAVDVIDERTGNMADAKTLAGLDDASHATIFIASANMQQMQGLHPRAAMLKQNKAASLSFSEKEGKIQGLLRMVAKDDQTATAIHSIAQGMISLTMLNQNLDPATIKLTQSLQLGVKGSEVSVEMDYPTTDIIQFLQTCKKRREAQQEN
jgi:hypothetical protein